MSRLFSVVVLCPNGRRESMKISYNSSILQILEEACIKQNLNPEEFDICHYKKPLDLSLPIRFANLPNNALLELHPTKNARKDCIVTIALQLESGERLMGDFTPSSTLLDVLKQCLKLDSIDSQENGEPVCIYMRQKITGNSIHTVTLRSLGLTNGTAIIRFLYKKPEDLESQAHVSSTLSAPVAIETKSDLGCDTSTSSKSTIKDECLEISNIKSELTVNTDPVLKESVKNETCNTMDMDYNKNDLNSIKPSTNVENNDLVMSNEERSAYTRKVTSNYFDKIVKKECDLDIKKEVDVAISENQIEMECDSDIKEEFEEIGVINYIGERHAVLYSLDDITDVKKADLPDEFFDLTIKDVRYLLDDYKKERVHMENQPLLTKEQRDRQILQNLARYSQTVIRIYFPERLVLQAVFNVTESVQTVYNFVKNYLENKDLDFYLYVTPPKEKLSCTKNLLECMLVPAAVVYFGCDIQLPSYLKNNLREQKSDPRAAALAASESRREEVPDAQFDIPPSSSNTPVKLENVPSSASDCGQSAVVPPKPEKLPKWMKLSRK